MTRQFSKKGFRGSKENYRPVSILLVISKIDEKLIGKLITIFMNSLLLNFQCGLRKGFSGKDSLPRVAVLKKWKSSVDKGKNFRALLTELSEIFDCFSHEMKL